MVAQTLRMERMKGKVSNRVSILITAIRRASWKELLKSGIREAKETMGPKPMPISNITWIPAWDHIVRS